MKRAIVRKDSYFDSVFLMLISTKVKKLPGITEAVVSMGTEMNRELISGMGLATDEVAQATANDLVIVVEADDEPSALDAAKEVDTLLQQKSGSTDDVGYRPGSFAAAHAARPESNLTIISLPGEFAAREARKALLAGTHVMLFSDNVSVEAEVSLKKLAVDRGLLMMGPDCGTAIINGEPICFANVVPRGPVGIVAASGTGLQEVSCAIAKAGSGVSQALGTGGRDIRNDRVGGLMMLACIEALGEDPDTRVICVISKPALASLTPGVIEALRKTGKPSVVHFVGSPAGSPVGEVSFAGNLTQAARMAVAIAQGQTRDDKAIFDLPDGAIANIVERETDKIAPTQRYLRGLFTGGTLCDEAATVLGAKISGIHSLDSGASGLTLADPQVSVGHTIVDLGEDVFTVGRPHPMIDPSIRTERLARESEDPEVALVLLDCVLGYGSHPDPAGALVEGIVAARQRAVERGGYLPFVASITGTDDDPQGLERQRRKLESAGVVVMPTNHQAAMLAGLILEKRG